MAKARIKIGKLALGPPQNVVASFEKRISKVDARSNYVLKLYVTGSTPRSIEAVANIRNICDRYLPGRYDLEVIDIYQQPQLAQQEQLIAAPTLVKQSPPPLRKFVGNLSDSNRVLIGLDLQPQP